MIALEYIFKFLLYTAILLLILILLIFGKNIVLKGIENLIGWIYLKDEKICRTSFYNMVLNENEIENLCIKCGEIAEKNKKDCLCYVFYINNSLPKRYCKIECKIGNSEKLAYIKTELFEPILIC